VGASRLHLHCRQRNSSTLTLSNPIFLPPAYSPTLIYFGRERGLWVTCNYPTVLKEKNMNRNEVRHYDFPVPDAFPHVVRTLANRSSRTLPLPLPLKRYGLQSDSLSLCFIVRYTRHYYIKCNVISPQLPIIVAFRAFNLLNPTGYVMHQQFNLLKTKRNLLYIRSQSVPRCKHFPPRL
jgi:hypothetical protein